MCFVGRLVCHCSFRTEKNLSHGAALVLMRSPLAARNVLAAALVIFSIGVAPVVLVTQSLLVLGRFDLAHDASNSDRRCGGVCAHSKG